MDFIEQLRTLSAKIPKLCEVLQTEEATKNALVMPFISILGYDVFDPTEVIPEFVADVGTKKGEKVDYAVTKDSKIIILFECKHCGADLKLNHASQLFRYFTVTDAKIACLTNGVVYRFYTDLEAPNKMDEKPFLEINMLDLNEALVAELKKLTKPAFNIDDLMSTAGDLKYTREIKRVLAELAEKPSDEFVKMLASKVFDGPLTPARREYFAGAVHSAFQQFINERINERLKSALGNDGGISVPVAVPGRASLEPDTGETTDTKDKPTLVTTDDEREGYYIIKAILRKHVAPERIIARDTQSYFGVLLDDNNRKPLARLHFNAKTQKYLGIFDEQRTETRVPINDLNDIYAHADKLTTVLAFYERSSESAKDGG
jgi:predicted type IV restriction endonuclease